MEAGGDAQQGLHGRCKVPPHRAALEDDQFVGKHLLDPAKDQKRTKSGGKLSDLLVGSGF
jgi:hypothetical protein